MNHQRRAAFSYLIAGGLLAGTLHCGGSSSPDAHVSASDASTGGLDAGSSKTDAASDATAAPDGCADASAIEGDIVNACGTIDPKAYAALAPKLGTAAGIAYRYGSACSGDGDAGAPPTWFKPTDHHYDNNSSGSENGPGWNYQVGGPESAPTDSNLNDYASNMGQALYVADGATDPGVLDLTPYVMGQNTFTEAPQLPWVYYGGGNPDVNVKDYLKTSTLLEPTAIGRCYGNSNWCTNSLTTFPNGWIVSAGSNTAHNENTFQLPSGKVPTAIAITNNSEFALVTVWDTVNVKGQIAVIALAGSGPPGQTMSWWGEWSALYPGLRNLGNIGFMKLLGFVDLPGMLAPTEISASADYMPANDDEQGWLCSPDGSNCRTTCFQLPLDVEVNRQSFVDAPATDGGIKRPNAHRYSKSGFAAVISKTEKKAIFLDLKPLFAKVESMYFGTTADFAKTSPVGLMDDQWPFAFTYAADFAPTIVSTITFDQAPTSVKTSLEVVDRAWIGTIDGKVHVYDVGGYGDNAKTAIPSTIAEVGTVAVGTNPTWIAYAKHEHGWTDPGHPIDKELIVVSRGECKIDWVKFGSDDATGSIVRTLRDSRLIDPISAEDGDNHGTESYILTVADYAGRQIAQYRYGPIIFWTNPGAAGNSVAAACQPPNGCGMGMSGTDPFEFGGAYATPGGAFRFTASNTP